MGLTIELPSLASQTAFNLERWSQILADPELAKLPYRIGLTLAQRAVRVGDANLREQAEHGVASGVEPRYAWHHAREHPSAKHAPEHPLVVDDLKRPIRRRDQAAGEVDPFRLVAIEQRKGTRGQSQLLQASSRD